MEEKFAKRKQTPGNTRPLGGGQGAGAKRKLAHLKKDAAATAPCDHCGKKHAGECWYKPGGKKRIKAEKKALNFLIIYAVIFNRQKLAKILWKRSEDPIVVIIKLIYLYYKKLLIYCIKIRDGRPVYQTGFLKITGFA